MTAEPIPLRAALGRANDQRVADDLRAVLREIVDRALREHAHKATITVEEFAALMRVSRSSVFEAVKRGDVASIRFGRRVLIPVPAIAAQLLGVNATNGLKTTTVGPDKPTAVHDSGDRGSHVRESE